MLNPKEGGGLGSQATPPKHYPWLLQLSAPGLHRPCRRRAPCLCSAPCLPSPAAVTNQSQTYDSCERSRSHSERKFSSNAGGTWGSVGLPAKGLFVYASMVGSSSAPCSSNAQGKDVPKRAMANVLSSQGGHCVPGPLFCCSTVLCSARAALNVLDVRRCQMALRLSNTCVPVVTARGTAQRHKSATTIGVTTDPKGPALPGVPGGSLSQRRPPTKNYNHAAGENFAWVFTPDTRYAKLFSSVRYTQCSRVVCATRCAPPPCPQNFFQTSDRLLPTCASAVRPHAAECFKRPQTGCFGKHVLENRGHSRRPSVRHIRGAAGTTAAGGIGSKPMHDQQQQQQQSRRTSNGISFRPRRHQQEDRMSSSSSSSRTDNLSDHRPRNAAVYRAEVGHTENTAVVVVAPLLLQNTPLLLPADTPPARKA